MLSMGDTSMSQGEQECQVSVDSGGNTSFGHLVCLAHLLHCFAQQGSL